MTPVAQPPFADALRAAIEEGDFAAFGACMLQRARLESGLASLAGRPAILAWLQELAAAFAQPRVHNQRQVLAGDTVFADVRITGDLASVPALGPLPVALAAESLHLIIWARLEAGLAVELSAITDWRPLVEQSGIPVKDVAVQLGAAAPCHRPLGELASGLGQLGTEPPIDTPGDHWVTRFNSRRLGGAEVECAGLQEMLTHMPDARLTLEQQLPTGIGNLLLLRLQGHIGGRRVSLPACKLRSAGANDEPLRFDSLALAATSYRPFHPK